MTYDCFTFFNELDLLEIRLNVLDKHVDFFILCESPQTFSGKPKELFYEKNKERFSKWNHKIIHVVAPESEQENSFERAFFQKEYLKEVLWKHVNEDDLVYYGDLDEIWRPFLTEAVQDKVYNLEQLNYSYFLNNRSSERWVGTIVGRWRTIKEKTLAHWRATHTYEVANAGWHFTNMGGPDQIRQKLDAYDHQEFNNEDIRSDVEAKIENGEDYIGRSVDWEGRSFHMWVDEVDLPTYLLDNKDKYNAYFK